MNKSAPLGSDRINTVLAHPECKIIIESRIEKTFIKGLKLFIIDEFLVDDFENYELP